MSDLLRYALLILSVHLHSARLARGMRGELLSSRDVDSSGISSSAAVGVACLLALEAVNDLSISALENIELDRRAPSHEAVHSAC